MQTNSKPKDWKTYDEFAFGIDTNRLPNTIAPAGRRIAIRFDDGRKLTLDITADSQVQWADERGTGREAGDIVEVAPEIYFIDYTFAALPAEAETLIVALETGRVLSIRSVVQDTAPVGEPQVAQIFRAGVVEGVVATGIVPAPTRDLVGVRAHCTYSPAHVYEHTYLSSERYCWQCLKGVQRGHGDVDMATTYKFADDLYIFTFREFKIPVAAVFFYNFDTNRSTGKFLGVQGDGTLSNNRAGAFIHKVSRTEYKPGEHPV